MKSRALAVTFTSLCLLACSGTSGGQSTPLDQDSGAESGVADAGGDDALLPDADAGTPADVGADGDGGDGGDGGGSVDGGADTGHAPSDATADTSTTESGPADGPPFAAGTVCNATGVKRTPPTRLKNVIVILMENENYGSVNGSKTKAPYINQLASQCGVATAYDDTCFGTDNLVSLPHYLALTSGSNCNTGLDQTGTGCIIDDNDATSHTLSTASIFSQVKSWKSYQEGMPSACDKSSGGAYATKHNPAAYYSTLAGCAANDVTIATLTCNATTTNTACSPAPSNAFTQDLANDTLAEFTLVTPTLDNDMHDGTITQADNWLSTYVPRILASKAYLRGDVAVFILWDEQNTANVGGPTPNVFLSPYITAGSTSATPFNHFAVLRAWENALGIATYLGCASGTQPGGGACPAGSTADVRAALNF